MLHRIAAIQMCSTQDIDENLEHAKKYIAQAAEQGAKLIVLPENFAIMGLHPKDKVKHKESFGHGVIQTFLSEQARHLNVWIVGGTIPLEVLQYPKKVYASTLVYNALGECVARYDKMHLFDIELRAHQEVHNESETIHAGESSIVFDTPFGKCGIAICYDMRFPELFRVMQQKGVEIVVVPAAFTVPTGKAHWETLLRSRAIENQVYVVASAQVGMHANGRKTYGHSMIVNPWGDVIALLADTAGVVCADVDMDFLHQLRRDFPVLAHRKL